MPGTKLVPNTKFSVDAFRYPGDHITGYFLTHAHGGMIDQALAMGRNLW